MIRRHLRALSDSFMAVLAEAIHPTPAVLASAFIGVYVMVVILVIGPIL